MLTLLLAFVDPQSFGRRTSRWRRVVVAVGGLDDVRHQLGKLVVVFVVRTRRIMVDGPEKLFVEVEVEVAVAVQVDGGGGGNVGPELGHPVLRRVVCEGGGGRWSRERVVPFDPENAGVWLLPLPLPLSSRVLVLLEQESGSPRR